MRTRITIKPIHVFLLCVLFGFGGSVLGIKWSMDRIKASETKELVATHIVGRFKEENEEMAASRQHDYEQWALSTDGERVEKYFQQGLMCGNLYGIKAIPELPSSYRQYDELCRKAAKKFEKTSGKDDGKHGG